jgi:hypothetical protein
VSDLDRWVNLEGPPPPGVRELLDAACPPLSPEKEAELDRKMYAALAADRRLWDRARRRTEAVKWIAVAAVFATAFGAGVLGAVTLVRGRTPPAPSMPDPTPPVPSAPREEPNRVSKDRRPRLAATSDPEAPPPDAGAAGGGGSAKKPRLR